jgi:cell division protein FtsB
VTVTPGPRLAPASARAAPLVDGWEDSGGRGDSVITLPRPAREAGLGGAPAREAGLGGAPAPDPRPARAPLRVLPTEHLERRARRRRARLTLTVAASLVAGSLLGVVAINVMIAQDQLRLDRLDAQRNAALAQRGQLQLQLAQLQAPARIVAQAEQRLGMVVPPKLTYVSGNGAPVQSTAGGAVPLPLPPPSPPAATPTSPVTVATPPTASSPPPSAARAGPAPPPSTTPSTVAGSAHR